MGNLHTETWSYLPVIGPEAIGIATLDQTWKTVAPADANRTGIVFHNPGTQYLRVAPANLGVQGNAGALLIYPQNDVMLFTGMPNINVSCEWKAWVDAGSNQPITVLDFIAVDVEAPPPQLQVQLTSNRPIESPVSHGVNLTNNSVPILAANPLRQGVMFMNANDSVAVAVCPNNLPASIGAGSIIVLPGQTKSFMGSFGVRTNCGWNGIAASAGATPLTILEYFH